VELSVTLILIELRYDEASIAMFNVWLSYGGVNIATRNIFGCIVWQTIGCIVWQTIATFLFLLVHVGNDITTHNLLSNQLFENNI
jgi:hypothetical protein